MTILRWLCCCTPCVALFSFSYNVCFEGLDDPSALKALHDTSQLVSLQSRPPASLNSLRYRIASDIPELLRVLRAFAYYDAVITTDLDSAEEPFIVHVLIEPGPQYTLSSYAVYYQDCTKIAEIANCGPFTPEKLGLEIGKSALAVRLVNAELQVLTELARCGHPLAYVDKRRVEVDMETKIVDAASCVQEGPLAKFGPSTFFGLKNINPEFVRSKMGWEEGEIYNADLIEETQKRLLQSELFSSVYILHGQNLDASGHLPMKLRFSEAKQQRISLGAFYGTVDGPGFTFAWAHRNVGGMGETLSAKGDISKGFIAGNLTFKKPDWPSFHQTYRALGELSRENIHAYLAFIYRGANFIDWPINAECTFSCGLKLEHINVSQSAQNDTYLLVGLPLFFRYQYTDSLLDPCKGLSVIYSATPYQSCFYGNQHFIKQRLTTNLYIPFSLTNKLTLAFRAQFGSIAGTQQEHVPLTKLFLGGSEDTLRGYRYKTVSPLNKHRKPLGGRSAIFSTVEMRIKLTKTLGIVPFADFGTVTFSQAPSLNAKWYKSVGTGLRYFTFFGPLRLDIGFPLNKRKHVDPNFRIYASVGQTF